MKPHAVHIWFNESQLAMLQAQSLVEARSISSIVKTAAMQYVVQHKFKIVNEPSYVRHVAQAPKPI